MFGCLVIGLFIIIAFTLILFKDDDLKIEWEDVHSYKEHKKKEYV